MAVGRDGDVVDDPHAVAEALGVAPLERLPDRRQAEGLPGVEGRVEVLPLDKLESVEVLRRRVPRLGPGDVEPGDALVAVAHGELGDLEGTRRGPHRREERLDDDRPTRRRRGAAMPARKPSRTDSTTSGSSSPSSVCSSGAKRTSA